MIRECAAYTLSICLDLIEQRDDQLRKQWYRKIYDEACKNLKSSSAVEIHGSILAIRSLVSCGRFMDSNIREVFDNVFKLRESKEIMVRNIVIQVLPDLALYDPSLFANEYLNIAMSYLLGQLKKDKDRNVAFISVGKIAKAIGKDIGLYLEAILYIIKEAFVFKRFFLFSKDLFSSKNRTQGDIQPLLQCISLLVVAVGPAMTKYMH